ncbi:MAG: hypothetical protein JWO57_4361, partial [Pseudonocardiales bacterium]|nr:hypothetical protein [Pseudonocardiales bacterium]
MTTSRRTFLGVAGVAAAGFGGVVAGVLPGPSGLDRLLGDVPAGGPSGQPGSLISGSFVSAARRGVRTGWTICYPPGQTGRRL